MADQLIEIPGLSIFILWGQAIAVVAAIAIRAGVGIRDMPLASGGEARTGLGSTFSKASSQSRWSGSCRPSAPW